MRAMILAAGKGERMGRLPGDLHKSLLPAGGEPLIVRAALRLTAAGLSPLVVNVCDRADQVVAALGDGSAIGNRILFSREQEALETAGGIANALPLLGKDTFMAVNADVHTDIDLAGLRDGGIAAMRELGTVAHLALVPNPGHNPGGDFGLDGRLVSRAGGQRPLTYSGIGLFDPEMFAQIGKGEKVRLADVLFPLVSASKVSGEQVTAHWLDVGTPERLRELERHLSENAAQ